MSKFGKYEIVVLLLLASPLFGIAMALYMNNPHWLWFGLSLFVFIT